MIKEFQYSFQDLEITYNDISELLGYYKTEIPDPFSEIIEIALKESSRLIEIKAAYIYFNQVNIDTENQEIIIGDQSFTPGETVVSQLRGATSIAIYICTAGNEIYESSVLLNKSGDHLLSYVLDIIGSLAAERAKEKLINGLESEVTQNGLNISDPNSPGHSDWNIAEQRKIFSLLPENFCGVQLTETLLMKPIKSVSGIIGIGKALSHESHQCYSCSDTDCIYGKLKRRKKN